MSQHPRHNDPASLNTADESQHVKLYPKSIVLVGLMGAGKTSLGSKLARHMGRPFIDSDAEIERVENVRIRDIFELGGEAHFRKIEACAIATILDGPPVILSTGGGAFCQPALRDLIKQKGGIPGYRARIRPIVSRITIHWPSFYNVVTGKTLALPNLIALQHIPLSPAGVIAKRPAPIALPNSCAAEWRMAPDAVFSPYASVRYFTPHMVHSQYNLL